MLDAPYFVEDITWNFDGRNGTLLAQAMLRSIVDGPDGETIVPPSLAKYETKYRMPKFPRRKSTVYIPCVQYSCSWVQQTAPAYGYRSVAWSPGLGIYCAVGSSVFISRVVTSPDGVTWTDQTDVPAIGQWNSICWSPDLSLFVAVGLTSKASGVYNAVMTSPNGVNWTVRYTMDYIGSPSWTSVCWSYDLHKFCAVTSGYLGVGKVYLSSDGLSWTEVSLPVSYSASWNSVCWAPGLNLFVAVSTSVNKVLTSPNGITWTERTTPTTGGILGWRDVTYATDINMLCAVGTHRDTGAAMVSKNGIDWAIQDTPGNNKGCVAWSPQFRCFVALSYATGQFGNDDDVIYSWNGYNWFVCAFPNTYGANRLQSVCWSPELYKFVTVGLGWPGISSVFTSK